MRLRRGSLPDLWLQPLSLIKRKMRKEIAGLATHLKGRVLDLGCGHKPYQPFIHGDGYYGLDLNASVRPDVVGTVVSLPLRDGSLDSVLCSEVLEHVNDPDICLREIARIVKPGGKLLLTTPMMWYLHREPYDFYRFTKYGLTHLLAKHGFDILIIRKTGGLVLFISTRILEETHNLLAKGLNPFFSLIELVTGKKPRGKGRLAAVLLLPLNLLLTLITLTSDRFSKKDVIGWAVWPRRNQYLLQQRAESSQDTP